MTNAPLNHAVRQIRKLAEMSATETRSDGDLLGDFLSRHDETAFTALVRRYGPLVLAVCRHVLRHEQDAEDAFQATFLVLAQSAASVRRREALAAWLHGTAYRIALRAKRDAARRRAREQRTRDLAPPRRDDLGWSEVQAILHEEIERLPERFRAPVVLCFLEGKSGPEAARELGLKAGTLWSRLTKARRHLQRRLARRGITPAVALTAAAVAAGAAGAVPPTLAERTVDSILLVTAGQAATAGAASVRVAALVERAARTAFSAKLRAITVVLLALGLAAGAVGLTFGLGGRPTNDPAAPAPVVKLEDGKPSLPDGNWLLTSWDAGLEFGDRITVITVATKEGQKTAAASADDAMEWKVQDLRLAGRLVTFRLVGHARQPLEFEGVLDPKAPTRVLGSLSRHGTMVDRADLEVTTLTSAKDDQTSVRSRMPAEWQTVRELIREDQDTRYQVTHARFREKDPAKQQALATAAAAAAKRYDERVPTLLREVYAKQQAPPAGYIAALTLVEQAGRLKATADEVAGWVRATRQFAAAHGPRFEAHAVARIAETLARQGGYDDLARRSANQADALARAAGLPPEAAASVGTWLEERAAWAAGPQPPADRPWTATAAGVVSDEKGRPVEGALVQINNTQWADVISPTSEWKTRTDANGRYTLTLRCGGTYRVHVVQIWADKPGFLQGINTERYKIGPQGVATVNFTLVPGELFGGVFKLRKTAFDRFAGDDPNDFVVFELIGPNYKRTAWAEKGKFECYVPPGTYEVRVNTGQRKLSWTGLKSGRGDHVLEQPPFAFTPETVGEGFDQMWQAMDLNYSHFTLKPDVDWKALRDKYRPRACAARNADELTAVLKEMLASLKDGHLWIERENGEVVGTYGRPWQYNGNRRVILGQLTETVECGQFATVGKTKADGFGYFLMNRQSAATQETVAKAVAAIEALRDAPGFVIDLRTANGGSEPLALAIAQLFCGKEVVYARSKFRNGRDHNAFSQEHPRTLPAAKSSKPYLKPVVCLLGPGCVSSGEGFAQMMRALPHVTTVGLPTRGSSGNPGPVDVGETGLVVYYSRWVDLLPDGTPIEGKGVPPAVTVDEPAASYQTGDPTLAKGLEVLRKRVIEARRGGR